jgi:tetratricopeptide (TPR) repeat protein
LGRAYLEKEDRARAKAILDRIQELDASAFVRNAECAALLGRWYRSGGNLQKADEVYAAALDADRDSHYLANVLAEVRLEAGRLEAAAEAFRRALAIIERLPETNLWTHATAANAAFFLGDDGRAAAHLEAASRKGLDADSLATVQRGLKNIAARMPDGQARLQTLLPLLRT